MSSPRYRYFALVFLVLALSAGGWQLFSSGSGATHTSVAPVVEEKAPGLAAPAISAPTTNSEPSAPVAQAEVPAADRLLSDAIATQPAPSPTPTTRQYRVALQIGHYKIGQLPAPLSRLRGDVGTAGGGRTEVDLNYDISTRVASLLRAQGILVDILPATVPSGYTADAFVAIHADGNASASPRGFKISTTWRSPIAWQDAALVQFLTSAYGEATGLPQDASVTKNMRGYYAFASFRPSYRVSNFTPSAIVEMGYMTNAADSAVLFNQPGVVASGIATGIESFLYDAYGSPRRSKTYGYGIADPSIDPHRTWDVPTPGPSASSFSHVTTGNWQGLTLGGSTINVRSQPGGGQVVGQLVPNRWYHFTERKGDYYLVNLPGGGTGWANRMLLIFQQ